jgi:hypothetical protein
MVPEMTRRAPAAAHSVSVDSHRPKPDENANSAEYCLSSIWTRQIRRKSSHETASEETLGNCPKFSCLVALYPAATWPAVSS